MSWFSRLIPPKINVDRVANRRSVPEGVWRKCDECAAVLYAVELVRNLQVCPKCDHHNRVAARARLEMFLDDGAFDEIGGELRPVDPLRFRDAKRYRDRLAEANRRSGESDALVAASGTLHGLPVVVCAFEFDFMGGSMGSVVGERFVRAVNAALAGHRPLVCFAASGGARMQEALYSLLQMGKTSAALTRLARSRVPYVSVLTDPTMGGVCASLAMLGDVIIAEPNALVGFAGPRVIEQTVRETLPEGFQRAEFLLQHGAVDMIVDRRRLRDTVHTLLSTLTPPRPVAETEEGDREAAVE